MKCHAREKKLMGCSIFAIPESLSCESIGVLLGFINHGSSWPEILDWIGM
jgi:hypothetical protein